MNETGAAGLPARHGSVWKRAGVIAALCAALVALASSTEIHAALIAFLDVAREAIVRNPLAGAALFVLFAALSAMLAFVSVAIVVPVAVYTWGTPLTVALTWVGWVLGGILAYGIGRFVGRTVVNWMTAGTALQRLERQVNTHTPFGMILLLQMALPSEIPGYVLGLTRYSFPKYLLAFSIAEIPYSIATVLLGATFVERQTTLILGIGVALIAMSVGLFYLLRKKLRGADPHALGHSVLNHRRVT